MISAIIAHNHNGFLGTIQQVVLGCQFLKSETAGTKWCDVCNNNV